MTATHLLPSPELVDNVALRLKCDYGDRYEFIDDHPMLLLFIGMTLGHGKDFGTGAMKRLWDDYCEEQAEYIPEGFQFKCLSGRSLQLVLKDQHQFISTLIHT